MSEGMRLEVDAETRVGVLRLDRPPVNALDPQEWKKVGELVDEAEARDDVGALVIWGGERNFAAGADIKAMVGMSMLEYRVLGTYLQRSLMKLAAMPKISIAAINGYALGGGFEIALAADFRYVADNAVLGLPEVKLGIMPGAGGTQRLQRLVGLARAKDLVLTGRSIDAQTAYDYGLAHQVLPADQVITEARALGARFASGPASLGLAKQALEDGGEMALGEALRLESSLLAACFASEDAQNGLKSFVESGPGRATFAGR
jgi:enoyl-CoA hydratase/carnithine racemase